MVKLGKIIIVNSILWLSTHAIYGSLPNNKYCMTTSISINTHQECWNIYDHLSQARFRSQSEPNFPNLTNSSPKISGSLAKDLINPLQERLQQARALTDTSSVNSNQASDNEEELSKQAEEGEQSKPAHDEGELFFDLDDLHT